MREKIQNWEQASLCSQISLDITNLNGSVRGDVSLSTPSNLTAGNVITDSHCDLPPVCPACLNINQSNS